MIFQKKIKIEEKIIDINLNNLKYKIKNIFIFGSPIGLIPNRIDEKNIFSQIKNISGYLFIIVIKKKSIIFITDPVSNFRVYYYYINNKIFIFNNLKQIRNFKNKLSKNIFNFFLIKNYTPGNQTFIKKLFKFQPCTVYKYDGKLKKKIYFEKNQNKPNLKKLVNLLQIYLDEESIKIKHHKKKNILLFSGGKDSCLLFQNLNKNKINFTPVYLHTFPETVETLKNLNLAKLYCQRYNKTIKIINIKINEEIPKSFFKHYMLFEYHLSLLHFFGVKKIKEIYGNNIAIISGQSCDSVLSLGPSQYTIANFIARFLIHFPNNFISKIFMKIINLKFKKNLYNIENLNDYYKSFYFSFFYYLIKIEENKNFKLEKDIKNFIKNDKNRIANLMYLKCHGFLQGPDNLILINAAKYFKIKLVVMPFGSYRFIQLVTKYYNFKLDIFFPKYVIDLLLDNYFLVKIKNIIYKKKTNLRLSKLDSKMKKKHIKIIKHVTY